jgi:hypothetical protein
MDNKEFERFNNSPSKSRGSPLREGGNIKRFVNIGKKALNLTKISPS